MEWKIGPHQKMNGKKILDIINDAFNEGKGKEFQGAGWYIKNYLIMGSKNGFLPLDETSIDRAFMI